MKSMVQIALLFSLIVMYALPACAVTLSVGSASGRAGDTVSVDVTLDTIPGYVAAVSGTIMYDASRLQFEVCDSSQFAGGNLNNMGELLFIGASASALDTGVLLSCKFSILSSNISSNSAELNIPLTFSDDIYCENIDGEFIYATTNNGNITEIKQQLTVALADDGDGFVTSYPVGISCPNGNCAAFFSFGADVSLLQIPDAISTFGGWSGCDSIGSKGECQIAMTGETIIFASYLKAPKAMVGAKPFTGIQAAYDDAATGGNSVIKLLDDTLIENFTAGRNIPVTLEGGYNAAFTSRNGESVIKGTVVLKSGTVKMKGIVVR